ncbi:hypothetical protein ACFZAU_40500 [Streptomyces sp. NPDC008238]
MCGQHAADRLDAAEAALVLVDERYERVCGRSSSAAKKDAATFRISLPRLSSALSFFSAFNAADSSVVVPRTLPGVDLVPPDPVPQRPGGADAELLSDRLQRGRLVRVVTPRTSDRSFAQLSGRKRDVP